MKESSEAGSAEATADCGISYIIYLPVRLFKGFQRPSTPPSPATNKITPAFPRFSKWGMLESAAGLWEYAGASAQRIAQGTRVRSFIFITS